MRLSYRLKHHFFSAFREFFVHHHNSLAFRAKIFALIIAADENAMLDNYIVVKDISLDIYNGDEQRATLLMEATRELVEKVFIENGLNIDSLVESIRKELKIIPRYAKKIDVESLQPLLDLSHDADTSAYQKNIIEFLQTLKDETLHTKKDIIKEDMKNK